MRYLGGKSRIAGRLAAHVNVARGGQGRGASRVSGFRPFWDPFCGGLSVSVALGGQGLVSDVNQALIELYRAVAAGWDPPRTLTREEWERARELPDSDPLKAFAGIGASWSGAWFHGYAGEARERTTGGLTPGRPVREAPVAAARASLLRDVEALVARRCVFAGIDFLAAEPTATDSVLYLDPPYAGVSGFAGAPAFDHSFFYSRVRQWSKFTDVFVSEYALPLSVGALLVWEAPRMLSGLTPGLRVDRPRERLYWLGPGECPVAVHRP